MVIVMKAALSIALLALLLSGCATIGGSSSPFTRESIADKFGKLFPEKAIKEGASAEAETSKTNHPKETFSLSTFVSSLVKPKAHTLRVLLDEGKIEEADAHFSADLGAFIRNGKFDPAVEALANSVNKNYHPRLVEARDTLEPGLPTIVTGDQITVLEKQVSQAMDLIAEYNNFAVIKLGDPRWRDGLVDTIQSLVKSRNAELTAVKDKALARNRLEAIKSDLGRIAQTQLAESTWPETRRALQNAAAALRTLPRTPEFAPLLEEISQKLQGIEEMLSSQVNDQFGRYNHFRGESFFKSYPIRVDPATEQQLLTSLDNSLRSASFEELSAFSGAYGELMTPAQTGTLNVLLAAQVPQGGDYRLAGRCLISRTNVHVENWETLAWDGACRQGYAAGSGKLKMTGHRRNSRIRELTMQGTIDKGLFNGRLTLTGEDSSSTSTFEMEGGRCKAGSIAKIGYSRGASYDGPVDASCNRHGTGRLRWAKQDNESPMDLREISGQFTNGELPAEGEAILVNGDRALVRKSGSRWDVTRNLSADQRQAAGLTSVNDIEKLHKIGWKALHEDGSFDFADAAFVKAATLSDKGVKKPNEPPFITKADSLSKSGHAKLMKGDISGAAQQWRDSLITKYRGYEKLRADYEIQKRRARSNEKMLSLIGFALGLAVDVKAAQDGVTGERSWASSLKDVVGQDDSAAIVFGDIAQDLVSMPEPPRVDSNMLSAGLPAGTVVRVPATTDAGPFAATVRVKTATGHCTGTRVMNPRLILTNAHCIVDLDSGEFKPQPWTVTQEGTRGVWSAKVVDWYTSMGKYGSWKGRNGGKRPNGIEDGSDWAILVLEKNSDLANWPLWRNVASSTPAEVLSGAQPLMLGGYSADLAKGFYMTLHYSCRVQASWESMMLSDCEMAGGSSGSAIYALNDPYLVVGLHNSGDWRRNGKNYSSGEVRVEYFWPALNKIASEMK